MEIRPVSSFSITNLIGLDLFRASLGTVMYIQQRVWMRSAKRQLLLENLDCLPDARMKFCLHRTAASACRVQPLFRLVVSSVSFLRAKTSERDKLAAH